MFSNNLKKDNISIFTAITAADFPNHAKSIKQANESLYWANNKCSFLSVAKMKESGEKVSNTAKQNGGLQNFQVDGYNIPLTLECVS